MKPLVNKHIHYLIVTLLSVVLTGINVYAQEIYVQDFESGFDGWEHQLSNPNQKTTWQRGTNTVVRIYDNGTPLTGPDKAQSGSMYLYFKGYNSTPLGEVAIVKSFDFTGYTNPVLSFYVHNMAEGTNLNPLSLTIQVRQAAKGDVNYNQITWNTVQNGFEISNKGDVWLQLNTCLTKYGNKDNVEIKIAIEAKNTPCNNIAIDNLRIYNFIVDDDEANFQHCSCYGSQDGKITAKPIGGGPLYQYSLSGDNFGEETTNKSFVYDNLASQGYSVTIKDVQTGCIARLPNQSVTIQQPAEIEVTPEIINDVKCYGDKNGEIKINAQEKTGNNTPYYYSLSTSEDEYPNSDVATFENISGGLYYARVRNKKNCLSKDVPIEIGKNVKLNIIDVDFLDIIDLKGCYGDRKGKITITAETSQGDIYYSIDGGKDYGNAAENRFIGLAAGEYNIKIKDNNNCVISWDEKIILKQPEPLGFKASEHTDVTGCYADKTGTIKVNVEGGTEPYSYFINDMLHYSSTGEFSGLSAGTYTPIVRDNNNCTLTANAIQTEVIVTITEPTPVKIDKITANDVSTCFGDNTGNISIQATGGTEPLFYSVEKVLEETTTENTQQGTENEEETNPDPEEIIHDWKTDNLFEGLTAGTYRINVQDNNQCQYVYYQERANDGETPLEVILEEPTKFIFQTATAMSIKNVCFGDNNGTIYVTAEGGTLPYTFMVGDISTEFSKAENMSIDNLPAGNYKVTAKDSKGCVADSYYNLEITQPDKLEIENVEIENVDCFSRSTGKAIITAKGGTQNYSYGFRSNDGTSFSYLNTGTIENLRAGFYVFSVKDFNKCETITEKYEIKEPKELTISKIQANDVKTCYGDKIGSIEIYVEGGTAPYQYSINGGDDLSNNNVFKDLPSYPSYEPFVVDNNNCTAYGPLTSITQPAELSIKNLYYHEVEGCKGTNNGAISFEADGGSGKLKFSVDGTTFTEALSANYTTLSAGVYYPTVEDSHGCRAKTQAIEITEPEKMEITDTKVVNAPCFGKFGEATITVSGGKAIQYEYPYRFYLNDSPDPASYTGWFNMLSAGDYSVKIVDKYQCTLTTTFKITEPEELKITDIKTKDVLTCYGDATGEAVISTSGGTKPLTFSASGFNYYKENTTGKFTDMPSSSFEIIATDKNGCSAIDYLEITQPEQLYYSARLTHKILCHDDSNSEIVISVSGGTGDYKYSVDNGKTYNYNNSIISGLPAGKYQIKVKDANNCTHNSYNITLVNPEPLKIEYEAYDLICNIGNTGEIAAKATGGTKPYFYSLDNVNWQQSTGLFNNLTDSTYIIKLHDQNNCTLESEPITLKRPKNIAHFSTDVESGCTPLKVVMTQDNQILLTNYKISNGDEIFDRIGPTEYTFVNNTNSVQTYTITASVLQVDGVGCADTTSQTITVYPLPQIDFRMGVDSVMWPENTANFGNLTKNIESVHWDFGDGVTSDDPSVSRHEYSSCGNYNIVLTVNDGRCANTNIKSFKVEPRPIEAVFNSTKPEGCQPVELSVENISLNSDSCKWDFGDGSIPVYNIKKTVHNYNEPGEYILTLTIYGDCGSSAITTKKISVYPRPEADFIQNLDTLYAGQLLKLESLTPSGELYLWNFGDGNTAYGKNVDHKYQFEGTFNISLTVSSENSCADTASSKRAVTVIANPIIVFPNAFSPNGDGKNDIFIPIHGDVPKYSLVILNRKGVVVFKTNDINQGWDGTRNGKICPPGMYVWKSTSMLRDKQILQQKGNVYLFR